MQGLLKSLLPVFESDHAHAKTRWRETFCVRALRRGLPKESRASSTHGSSPQCQDKIVRESLFSKK